jgi:hypothetical protein
MTRQRVWGTARFTTAEVSGTAIQWLVHLAVRNEIAYLASALSRGVAGSALKEFYVTPTTNARGYMEMSARTYPYDPAY